jgi:hypothetical protein
MTPKAFIFSILTNKHTNTQTHTKHIIMSNNSAPKSYDPIVQHLEDAADGAHTYGAGAVACAARQS